MRSEFQAPIMRLNLILFKVEGEKQDEVKSEKKKFPETRQKEYGWREPNELYKKLSGHARPVQSIHKNLKWPVDGCY